MTDYVYTFSNVPFGGVLEAMKGFAAGEANNQGAGGGGTAIQLLVGRASWLAGKASGYSHFIELEITTGAITNIKEYIPTLSIVRTWNPTMVDLCATDYQSTIQVP